MDRRSFLHSGTLGSIGLTLPATYLNDVFSSNPFSSLERIKVGVIGSGLRGQNHVNLFLKRNDCDVVAIADIDDRMVEKTKKLFEKANKPFAKVYDQGPHDYKRMLQEESLDAVIIATPWRWHTEMSIAAMEAGVYTGVEVCGAFSLDECWQLVNTHEKTGTHLMFLENVCYRRDVMAILNLVRQDKFGELIHLEGGYQHDLRAVKFNNGQEPYGGGVEFGEKAFSEAKWRTTHSVHRNGDLYPTHGVGPIAMYADINRGNRFLSLVSMASKARGLHDYIVDHPKGGKNHPNASVEFKLGDKVTTMIKAVNGETFVLHHDTNLPRPYSLGFRVQGTKGLWMDVNQSLHIEGESPAHQWEEAQSWLDKNDHPLWKELEHLAVGAGHGGMDFFLMHEFVESVKAETAPPIDVYDAATWLAITPMSEASISAGSAPQQFPDFTRGGWMHRKNEFAKS